MKFKTKKDFINYVSKNIKEKTLIGYHALVMGGIYDFNTECDFPMSIIEGIEYSIIQGVKVASKEDSILFALENEFDIRKDIETFEDREEVEELVIGYLNYYLGKVGSLNTLLNHLKIVKNVKLRKVIETCIYYIGEKYGK